MSAAKCWRLYGEMSSGHFTGTLRCAERISAPQKCPGAKHAGGMFWMPFRHAERVWHRAHDPVYER